MVSAIPATTLLARPLAAQLPVVLAVASGAVLLAAGLVGLALLPSSELAVHARPRSRSAGSGSACRCPGSRTRCWGARTGPRKATLTVGFRHVGLVVALAIGAPLVAGI